jgi:Lon protease-like protein
MHESKARPIRALPDVIPVFPLSGAILLPRDQLPLRIFEPRYLAMVEDVLKTNRIIGIVQPTEDEMSMARPPLYRIGGVGRITSFMETEDGRYLITLTGLSRFEIERELEVETPYRQALVSYSPFAADRSAGPGEEEIDRPVLLAALKRYFEANQIDSDWESIERAPAEALVNSLSRIAPVEPAEKQALLEAPTLRERAQTLVALIELALAEPSADTDHKPN